MSSPAPGPVSPLVTLRITAAAITVSPLVLLVAMAFVLSDSADEAPPLWALGAVVAYAAVIAVAASSFGYRVRAIAPGTPPEEARGQARAAFSSSTTLRLALAESVTVVSVVLAFLISEGGLLVVVVGAVLGVVIMTALGWPGDRSIARVQEALESEGTPSSLREALGA